MEHESKSNSVSEARTNDGYLTQQQAAMRSDRVSNVAYILTFDLTGEETFSATSTIIFDLSDNSSPLTIDLDDAEISELIVNGTSVEPEYNKWFITLDADQLIKGKNRVKVSFNRKHSTDGEGLHRFQDPVDNKVYLYSHFEPLCIVLPLEIMQHLFLIKFVNLVNKKNFYSLRLRNTENV